RAETATDPAPLSMFETTVVLKPRSEWPRIATWYSGWAPEWATTVLRHITPDTISTEELVRQLNTAVAIPGVSNSWTMPTRGRINMPSTGRRTAVGLKVSGPDSEGIQATAAEIESLLKSAPGTRTVLAERSADGYFLDVQWQRERLTRLGISMADAQK